MRLSATLPIRRENTRETRRNGKICGPSRHRILFGILILSLIAWIPTIGMHEDYYMVPAMTGHQPDLLAWLWSKNNEHRRPVQRLTYLCAHGIATACAVVPWAVASGLYPFRNGGRDARTVGPGIVTRRLGGGEDAGAIAGGG